jgi:hypothetical protein
MKETYFNEKLEKLSFKRRKDSLLCKCEQLELKM